jgi:prevent-host-death family protein
MSATIADAKKDFCSLVSQAEQGRETIITRHNKPAARLGPVARPSLVLYAEWQQRRKKIRLNRPGQKNLSLVRLIQEGRK